MDEAQKSMEEFQISREELLKLWGKVKDQNIEGLSEIESFYAGIIKNHEAMFIKEVDGVANPEAHEYEPEQGVNPYLHILLHGLVETQVIRKQPIEVIQFVNAMKKRDLAEHAIHHLLCAIFFPLILEGRNRGGETDMAKYATLLKQLKTKKPEKIDAFLDKKFHQTIS
ncbi:hypothetical protein DSLASN_24520 [Desulfoluna limicola]|uniref:DUF1841 family protein n=1 Tax=Desulfoluna limicola TaxID=2810562 RepID=A0ABM7PI21_9BACT|nr:DUF1841 family protein [Desulfoluna limicola]BCS96820.1 hypothetical protein DSLASN_24520 [Desulfoluna limicola]